MGTPRATPENRPAHLRRYPDWEEACRHSRANRAVAEITVEVRGTLVRAEIVKPRYGDAVITYFHSGLVMRPATTREVDSIKSWKVY